MFQLIVDNPSGIIVDGLFKGFALLYGFLAHLLHLGLVVFDVSDGFFYLLIYECRGVHFKIGQGTLRAFCRNAVFKCGVILLPVVVNQPARFALQNIVQGFALRCGISLQSSYPSRIGLDAPFQRGIDGIGFLGVVAKGEQSFFCEAIVQLVELRCAVEKDDEV